MSISINFRPELVKLYAEIAAHTKPECAKCCVPNSCCAKEFCDMAADYAEKQWGETLQPTGHPTLPFMGPTGCVVAPHLRPICALHTCEINSVGVKRGDEAWTSVYFDLRNRIDEIELECGL